MLWDMQPDKRKKFSRWIIGIVGACILIFLGVQHLRTVANAVSWCMDLASPLLVGLAMAFILNVPLRFFENHLWPKAKKKFWQGMRRPIAILISILVILSVLTGVILLVIPELMDAIGVLVDTAADVVEKLSKMDKADISKLPMGKMLLEVDWEELQTTAENWLKRQGGTILTTAFDTIGSLLSGIFNFFISFVFAIYILFNKAKLKKQVKRLVKAWIPRKQSSWLIHAAAVGNSNLRNFISGQTIEACILGFLCMIGMFILDLPYAPMVGTLVGVTAFIPVLGAFLGAGIGAFMILTVSPMQALIFLIFLLVLQQIEENLIYPRVMGRRVNLPGMWVLAAVTLGGGIAGPVGMLLAVPIASTVYTLVKEATLKREQKKAE